MPKTVIDVDGISHVPTTYYEFSPPGDGWFICLCDKHVAGPEVDVKAHTCLSCCALSSRTVR